MSAMESDLRNERPERPGEFTFTWSIQNYSYYPKEYWNNISSPGFLVEFLGKTRWCLVLYPKGRRAPSTCRRRAPGFVICYLSRHDGDALDGDDEKTTFNFTLAIRMSNGQFKEGGENVYDDSNISIGYSKFVSFEELKGSAGYLDNDTLTVRCRMWKTGVDIPASEKWEALSRIKVSKLDYTWILNDLPVDKGIFENKSTKSISITEYFSTGTEINLKLFKKESLGECSLQFGIEMIKPKKNYFWIAVVHLMDADGSVTHSTSGEHRFEADDDENLLWSFALLEKKSNKKLYLPNNILILRCELSFSAHDEFETHVFRKNIKREYTTMKKQSDLQRVWIKNMQECYKERKFSDFIIRTRFQQFPVHRIILSAQSEVFDAMFERDMKESKTGIVDIEDLDDGTVSNMLKYVYTSTFDVTDCHSAQNLYFAAEKYRIADLKEQCSSYLRSCLDASNVCDILELAHRHEDKDLKSYARNFFRGHATEIMVSESWEKLTKNNIYLANETMRWSICNMNVTVFV